MSRWEQLIAELCPDGVEYHDLGAVATISRGGSFQKKDYIDYAENGFPCIHYGQIYTKYNLFVSHTISYISSNTAEKQKKAVHGDIIMAVTSENIEDVCKCIAWLGNEEVAVSGHTVIIHHTLNPKYLVYYLSSSLFFQQKLKIVQGTKVMEVSPEKLKKAKIPVPPLPIQQEIVRILDSFTELTAELTAKLTAELTARRKQYEYYRDSLLTNSRSTKQVTLGDICNLKAGKAIPSTEISVEQTVDFPFPCYGGNGLRGYVGTYNQSGNFSLVGRQGALCGNVCYVSGKFYATEHAVVVTQQGEYNERFLYYLLEAANLNQYKTTGAQPGLSVARLEKVLLPIPPLEEQARIVSILDRFDALCNDLISGLPAEIEARRKQYDYYRDKLLTFQEKDVTA